MFAKLANNRKLEEATSAKDDVAPIYVLDEIAEMANGGGDTAQGLADATVKRLGNKSPIVKHKALRLIKHVTNKGASEYRRAICKQAKEIRDLTHYRGEPDPFKGDVLNQKVRDAAKETLDAIFQATDTNYSSSAKPTLTNRIQGFGSTNSSEPDHASPSMGSYSGGFSSSSNNNSTTSNGAGGGMVGFGNPRFNTASRKASSTSSSSTKWLPASVANKLDSLSMLPKDRAGGLRFEGNGGYSSGDDSPSRQTSSSYSRPTMPQDSQRSPLTYTPNHAPAHPSGRVGSGVGDEAHLVDDMCTPGGLRAQPDREDLRQFVESAASLSGTAVAELLQAKMEGGSWQEVLRALCALEAVISQGSSAACGEIAVHFQANAGVVRTVMKSPQASVRMCAMRVFKLLGGDTLPEAAQAAAVPAPPAAVPDLMTDLLGEADTPAAAPASQDFLGDLLGSGPDAPPAAASNAGGMFAGLDVGSSPQQPSQPATAPAPAAPQSPFDALAGLQGSSPSPLGSAPEGQAADMFGGLSMEAPSAAQSQSGLDALMGLGTSTPQPPAQAPAAPASADLFGGLSVGVAGPSGNASASRAPSGATSTAADLEGLFTTASPTRQATPQGPAPQLWSPTSRAQGSSGMGGPQAGMGMQGGFLQPGMGHPPNAPMGYMPGFPAGSVAPGMLQPGLLPPGMFPPGMLPPGMLPPGMNPGMLHAMQFAQLGPGGMPSGHMPQNPTNPLQGMPGVPSAQMEYLQRQMQAMGMQRPQGLGQQPYPGLQMPGGHSQLSSAGSSGLSDFLSGPAPQGSSPSAPVPRTDLLGRALSATKQDSFDFIGEHIGNLKK
ncbi:hypothetical protein ABBQ38_004540 [Trebouxia sp. C0009 RCD-2024]